jgi:hypothetical protein
MRGRAASSSARAAIGGGGARLRNEELAWSSRTGFAMVTMARECMGWFARAVRRGPDHRRESPRAGSAAGARELLIAMT